MLDSRVMSLPMLEIVLAIRFSSTAMHNYYCVLDHRIDSSTVYLLLSLSVVSGGNGGNPSPEPLPTRTSSPAMSHRVRDNTVVYIGNLLLI